MSVLVSLGTAGVISGASVYVETLFFIHRDEFHMLQHLCVRKIFEIHDVTLWDDHVVLTCSWKVVEHIVGDAVFYDPHKFRLFDDSCRINLVAEATCYAGHFIGFVAFEVFEVFRSVVIHGYLTARLHLLARSRYGLAV